MDREHIVGYGEYLVKIAADYGTTWQLIWNHPKNAEHRNKRRSPNVLYPGDVLVISVPDPPPGTPGPEGSTPWPSTTEPPGGSLPSPPAAPWAYHPEAPTPPSPVVTWECPTGTCVCHPPEETRAEAFAILLCDPRGASMRGARCRVFSGGSKVFDGTADDHGWVAVAVTGRLPSTVMVEWAPGSQPMRLGLPHRKRAWLIRTDAPSTSKAAHGRRVRNLAFDARRMFDSVTWFESTFASSTPSGRLQNIASALLRYHDERLLPVVERRPLDEVAPLRSRSRAAPTFLTDGPSRPEPPPVDGMRPSSIAVLVAPTYVDFTRPPSLVSYLEFPDRAGGRATLPFGVLRWNALKPDQVPPEIAMAEDHWQLLREGHPIARITHDSWGQLTAFHDAGDAPPVDHATPPPPVGEAAPFPALSDNAIRPVGFTPADVARGPAATGKPRPFAHLIWGKRIHYLGFTFEVIKKAPPKLPPEEEERKKRENRKKMGEFFEESTLHNLAARPNREQIDTPIGGAVPDALADIFVAYTSLDGTQWDSMILKKSAIIEVKFRKEDNAHAGVKWSEKGQKKTRAQVHQVPAGIGIGPKVPQPHRSHTLLCRESRARPHGFVYKGGNPTQRYSRRSKSRRSMGPQHPPVPRPGGRRQNAQP
ncbi:MAG: LysM peptidoglycan-binding domain-containing protein [Myxococcota bacterium]